MIPLRILIADDEPQILRTLSLNLRVRHYDVRAVPDGGQALAQAADWHLDLIILDLGLPDLDGIEVIQGLRGWTHMPIIVLSGRAVLEVLLRNPGKLVSQRRLLIDVWGPAHAKDTHYLRVYLAGMRRKLEQDPSRPRHLITEPGMGYRFEP